MSDKILESLFLDNELWREVLDWGIRKRVPPSVLSFLQDPHGRAVLCEQIYLGEYQIEPPRTGYVPKDNGGERTFFYNDPLTRMLFHAIYLWLSRNEGERIHPSCLSYQQGVGIGRIVTKVSNHIQRLNCKAVDGRVGRKFDIHHYFDSVPRKLIHQTLDSLEQHHGHSSVIDLLRRYYDSDLYFDTRKGKLVEEYKGIKQGCAVSSWFANVLLYPLDDELSSLGECYVRYSDDILYIGDRYEEATHLIQRQLKLSGLVLNDEKTEDVYGHRFVRFLGYDIRGAEVTLSEKWVKSFQHTIDSLTRHDTSLIRRVRAIRSEKSERGQKKLQNIMSSSVRRLARTLYYGDGRYSWATLVLPVINREEDILQLNNYCLDALRAVYTGKTHIGGLGKSAQSGIVRGKGRNVASNRRQTTDWLKKFYSLTTMKRAVHNRWLYRALVLDMLVEKKDSPQPQEALPEVSVATIEEAYESYLMSEPDGKTLTRFYAKPLEEMTMQDLLCADNRKEARERLEQLIASLDSLQLLAGDKGAERDWFWQSPRHPELVVLKEWITFAEDTKTKNE